MPKAEDYVDDGIDLEEDDPIPAKRDTKIFQRNKEEKAKKEEKDEDFEEDVFV